MNVVYKMKVVRRGRSPSKVSTGRIFFFSCVSMGFSSTVEKNRHLTKLNLDTSCLVEFSSSFFFLLINSPYVWLGKGFFSVVAIFVFVCEVLLNLPQNLYLFFLFSRKTKKKINLR